MSAASDYAEGRQQRDRDNKLRHHFPRSRFKNSIGQIAKRDREARSFCWNDCRLWSWESLLNYLTDRLADAQRILTWILVMANFLLCPRRAAARRTDRPEGLNRAVRQQVVDRVAQLAADSAQAERVRDQSMKPVHRYLTGLSPAGS